VLLEVEVEVLEDEVYALVVVHHVLQPARAVRPSIVSTSSQPAREREREREPACVVNQSTAQEQRSSRLLTTDLTMFRCCISLRREISRMAVDGTPSSSCSSRIFLSAIVSLVYRSLPLYTTPYVPSPIFSTFSYCAHHRAP
jgi:hypothetical protein